MKLSLHQMTPKCGLPFAAKTTCRSSTARLTRKNNESRLGTARHDDLSAGWKVWICLLQFYSRNEGDRRKDAPNRCYRQTILPVFAEHRSDAGRQAGMVYAQRYR